MLNLRFVMTASLPYNFIQTGFPPCSYDLLIDGESKKSGSILEDFDPSINPPEEIDDPEDKKPEDWVDSPK